MDPVPCSSKAGHTSAVHVHGMSAAMAVRCKVSTNLEKRPAALGMELGIALVPCSSQSILTLLLCMFHCMSADVAVW